VYVIGMEGARMVTGTEKMTYNHRS